MTNTYSSAVMKPTSVFTNLKLIKSETHTIYKCIKASLDTLLVNTPCKCFEN